MAVVAEFNAAYDKEYAEVVERTGWHAMDADAVLSRMRGLLPNIATIDVQWSPAGCTPENCESVRVAVTGLQHHWLSPLPGIVAPLVLPLPGFGTTLTREAMRQDPNSASFCAP